MFDLLQLAGKVSLPTDDFDPRNFWIGCVGVRDDGAIVSAKNGAVFSTTIENYHLIPESHAEGRVLRKLGKRGVLYVARVAKASRDFAMSRPCPMCQNRIRSFGVKKVYYTINKDQYGVWIPDTDVDRVYNL